MEEKIQAFVANVANSNKGESEFIQAVEEVATTLIPFIEANPKYQNQSLLERMVEPEKTISFRVPWVNDKGEIVVNKGYRVQFNSAIGPYKGGMRFHPSVNLSILKFLGFEQTFKNALTTLPMGGGKGGSNFDPKGKTDGEVMRFCQSFMQALYTHIGADTDVPAGDIGVSAREIGYMFGMYKKLAGNFTGVFTGKGISFGGSLLRPEATGYGVMYFVQQVLAHKNATVKGQSIIVSGSGNVAQFAVHKAITMGAKVLTMSDSSGYIYDKHGLTQEKLQAIMQLKNVKRGRIEEITQQYADITFVAGKKPWEVSADIALPCATQNETALSDAQQLVENGVKTIVEGANMPTVNEAIMYLQEKKVTFVPGKASNAGGVAVSGLEMSQNSLRFSWTAEEVDAKLQAIMQNIFTQCVAHGKEESGYINFVKGANIAGFIKVADAMLAQGVV
jgi:glutamate dehydrogenase (NADP+)